VVEGEQRGRISNSQFKRGGEGSTVEMVEHRGRL
jgi:hypothetical protein